MVFFFFLKEWSESTSSHAVNICSNLHLCPESWDVCVAMVTESGSSVRNQFRESMLE